MSPRAACRLEQLGYTTYDYVAGKADWLAAGLPTIRQPGGDTRALDVADRTPATCRHDDTLGVVAARTGPNPVVVLSNSGIVLGVLTDAELRGDQAEIVEKVMRPGPATVRANEPLQPLLQRMREHNVDAIIITTPEGLLLGVVRRAS